MNCVVETVPYLGAADRAGLSEEEREEIIDIVARNPEIGDLVQGAGGLRKFRFAGRGKGKSGGYRIIAYFADERWPVFLVTAFSKGQKANLSAKERADLGVMAKALIDSYFSTVDGNDANDKGCV